MGTTSVKLPPSLEARLDVALRRRKQPKSEFIREAIERLLDEGEGPVKGSVFDLVKDLKGIGTGPRDLSTSPKHMRGFGKSKS